MRISDWSSDVCSSDLRKFRPRTRFPDPEKYSRVTGIGAVLALLIVRDTWISTFQSPICPSMHWSSSFSAAWWASCRDCSAWVGDRTRGGEGKSGSECGYLVSLRVLEILKLITLT